MKSITIISIILLTIIYTNGYSQWEHVGYTSNGFTKLAQKSSMDFFNSEVGIINYSEFSNDTNSYYYITYNSGNNWEVIDTTFNTQINDFEYGFGWGISGGAYNNIAKIELIFLPIYKRISFSFIDLKNILQIEIVDSSHAVYSGISKNDTYVIGLITKQDDNLTISINRDFGEDKIDKIRFFSTTSGYLFINNNLYKTNDLGITNETIVSDLYDFDFYDINTGVYIKDNYYKTTNKGETWTYLYPNYSNYYRYNNLLMISENLFIDFTGWVGTDPYILWDIRNLSNIYGLGGDFYYTNIHEPFNIVFLDEYTGFFTTTNNRDFYRTYNKGGYNAIQNINENNYYTIYPNPTKDIIHVKTKLDIKTFKITSTLGLNIQEGQVINNMIDLSKLAIGVYYISLFDSKGIQLINNKIIKE